MRFKAGDNGPYASCDVVGCEFWSGKTEEIKEHVMKVHNWSEEKAEDLVEDFEEFKNGNSERGGRKPYFEDGKFIPKLLADEILEEENLITMRETEEIYAYNNGIFEPNGKTVVKELAQEKLGQDVKIHYVNETLECVRRATYISVEEFGGPEHLLACENGVLNLKTHKLEDFDPEYLMITKIPVKYDPAADTKEIENFVADIVHEDDVAILQELVGFSLWKDYPIAKAAMLLGGGANGKSTFLNLLEAMLGDENTSNVSLQDLCYNRFAKIRLHGKLANIHADLSSNELSKTGAFKMATGGDTIQGEKKHVQEDIPFKNHAKLLYSANKLPKTDDMSDAYFRRWIVIDFPYKFTDDSNDGHKDKDRDILDKLTTDENLSAMLNWALEGLERLLENDEFSHSEAMEEVKKKWIAKSDSLRYFVDKQVEIDFDSYVTKQDFYNAYCEFCSLNDLDIEKKSTVTRELPTIISETYKFRPAGDNGKRPEAWNNIKLPDVSQQRLVGKTFEVYHGQNGDGNPTEKELIGAVQSQLSNVNEARIKETVKQLATSGKITLQDSLD